MRRSSTFLPQIECLEARAVPAFGTNGIVLSDPTGWIEGIALQTDGKIVAAGDIGLARYNTDGTLDPSFNPGGSTPVVIVTGNGPYFNDVAIQGDGKVVVGGRGFEIRRYTAEGVPDPTFGTNGVVNTNINTNKRGGGEFKALSIQPWDQKILAVGYTNSLTSTPTWAVARYNPNGSLDTTFNRTGIVSGFGKGNDSSSAQAVVFQPANHKIVVVGRAPGADGYQDFALARYNEDGSLDKTFGSGGKVLTDFQSEQPGLRSSDTAYDVQLQADGKFVVVGRADGIAPNDFAVARYNANGSLDTTFAGDGKLLAVSPSAAPTNFFESVALQSDGKIVAVGGYSYNGLAQVACIQPDGSLDPTFDGDGWQIFQFYPAADTMGPHDVAVQPGDGKIVVAGGVHLDALDTNRFALARLNPDGSFDGSPLQAAAPPPGSAAPSTLTRDQAQALASEAVARWAAAGVDVRSLGGFEVRVADLGGMPLGLAAGNTIWLDDDAAGWGWFVDPTPGDDTEFTTPGDQGEQGRMDLLTVLMHEMGHLLGLDHDADGVMQAALPPGTRLSPAWLDLYFTGLAGGDNRAPA
jgi:uncharacterized delta-60 repeat protein